MTKSELEPFRNQLQQLDRQLRLDADTLADEAFHTTDAMDSMAMGNLSNIPVEDREERGADNYCVETTVGLVENVDARLREVNAALERIDDGTFGKCEECAQELSIDRLQAVPFARRCVKCARAAQQGEPASPGNL
jgi:RNA polymerase-binding transcription factor DksA